jgi:hypothetical protein
VYGVYGIDQLFLTSVHLNILLKIKIKIKINKNS